MIKLIRLNLLVAVMFLLFFIFNDIVFHSLALDQKVSWIFLPAGLRLMFALVYRWQSFWGLWAGSFVAGIYASPGEPFVFLALTAFISAMNPLIALTLMEKLTQSFTTTLGDLKLSSILSLAIIQATLCTTLHHLCFVIFKKTPQDDLFSHLFVMFFGDMIGIVMLMILLTFMFKVLIHRHRKALK